MSTYLLFIAIICLTAWLVRRIRAQPAATRSAVALNTRLEAQLDAMIASFDQDLQRSVTLPKELQIPRQSRPRVSPNQVASPAPKRQPTRREKSAAMKPSSRQTHDAPSEAKQCFRLPPNISPQLPIEPPAIETTAIAAPSVAIQSKLGLWRLCKTLALSIARPFLLVVRPIAQIRSRLFTIFPFRRCAPPQPPHFDQHLNRAA